MVLDAYNGMKAREGMTQWMNHAVAERRQINAQNEMVPVAVNATEPTPEPTVPEPVVHRVPEPEPEPVPEPEVAGNDDSDSRSKVKVSADPKPAAISAALQPTVDTAAINEERKVSDSEAELELQRE